MAAASRLKSTRAPHGGGYKADYRRSKSECHAVATAQNDVGRCLKLRPSPSQPRLIRAQAPEAVAGAVVEEPDRFPWPVRPNRPDRSESPAVAVEAVGEVAEAEAAVVALRRTHNAIQPRSRGSSDPLGTCPRNLHRSRSLD